MSDKVVLNDDTEKDENADVKEVKYFEGSKGFRIKGDTLYIKKLSQINDLTPTYRKRLYKKGVNKIFVEIPNPDIHLKEILLNRLGFVGKLGKIKDVQTADDSTGFCVQQNMIFRKTSNGNLYLLCCLSDESDIEIPEGVVEIGKYAFQYSNIRSIKLPDSLKIIHSHAFCKCDNLKEVKFGKGHIKILNHAFSRCRSLTHMDLKNATMIKENAFHVCENLDEVELGDGLDVVESHVFSMCSNLKKISLPASVKKLEPFSLGNVEDLYIEGDHLPEGIIGCSAKLKGSYCLKIHLNGKTAMIPKSINNSQEVDIEIFLSKFEDGINETMAPCFFSCDSVDGQEVALDAYCIKPDQQTKDYLITRLPQMLERRESEEAFLSLFSRLSENDLLTEDAIEKALSIALNRNWILAVVCVLGSVKTKENSQDTPCLKARGLKWFAHTSFCF